MFVIVFYMKLVLVARSLASWFLKTMVCMAQAHSVGLAWRTAAIASIWRKCTSNVLQCLHEYSHTADCTTVGGFA